VKIRALTISHILPSFNASVSNIVYTTSAQTITYSESTPDISYDIFIVPMTNLPGLSVTVIDSIPLFTIGSNPSDSITVSENVLKSIAAVFSNSVTASDTSFRAFSSSVDFDPSDSDLDPDPVTVSDSQTFSLDKIFSNSISLSDSPILTTGKVTTDSVTSGDTAPLFTIGQTSSDSVSASESVAKSVAKPTTTDSVTSSDTAPVLNPGKVATDSVTSGDTAPVFTVGQTSSDSVTASESIAKAIATPSVADSVTSGDTAPVFSIGQVSSDSVSTSDAAPVFNIGQTSSDSVSTSDAAPVFNIGQVSSDSVSVSESVSTELLLGATTPLFSYAFVSDGPFVRTLFNAQSHYNNSNYAYEAQTGMLNGPGMIGNSPMFNDLFITYTQNDGFNIDFIYTSVDDRAINGYMLNETVMVGTSLNV
tara:strand:- start:221 stop:1483 length:1263 start_codon:yes stop_codon:yes gene_type:complete